MDILEVISLIIFWIYLPSIVLGTQVLWYWAFSHDDEWVFKPYRLYTKYIEQLNHNFESYKIRIIDWETVRYKYLVEFPTNTLILTFGFLLVSFVSYFLVMHSWFTCAIFLFIVTCSLVPLIVRVVRVRERKRNMLADKLGFGGNK